MRLEDRLLNAEFVGDAQFRALLGSGFELELIAHERMYKKHVSFAGTWSARAVHPLTGETKYLVRTNSVYDTGGQYKMKEFSGILGLLSFIKSLGYLTASFPMYATGWTRIGPPPAPAARPVNWDEPWFQEGNESEHEMQGSDTEN